MDSNSSVNNAPQEIIPCVCVKDNVIKITITDVVEIEYDERSFGVMEANVRRNGNHYLIKGKGMLLDLKISRI